MKDLKEILNEYNCEVEFPIFGETLVISGQRNIFNQLRWKYRSIANEVQGIFNDMASEITNIQDYLEQIRGVFYIALETGLKELKTDAISVGCYTLDTDTIINKCMKKGYFKVFNSALEDYQAQYDNILRTYSYQVRNIRYEASNHARLEVSTIGGGISDVIGNQLKADMTNAVIGGIADSFADDKVATVENQAKKQIAELFNNQKYKNAISNGVWCSAANLRLIISNYLNDECNLNLGGWTTNDDSTKAEAIYNNMTTLELPEEKQREFALEILNLNPYVSKYYESITDKYPERIREILDIAEFFHIDIMLYIQMGYLTNIVKDFADETYSSYEWVSQCRETLNKKIAELRLPDESGKFAELLIQEHICTFIFTYLNNNMRETRQEAFDCYERAVKIADELKLGENKRQDAYKPYEERMEILDRELVEKLSKWVEENIGTTEDDAHNCRDELTRQIEEERLAPEKAANIYKTIDDKLKKLDEEYRTVETILFPTRDSADEAKAIIEENKEILYKPTSDFIFRSDYTAHIEAVKEVQLHEKLILRFTNKYEQSLKEFDKKCKNAKLYDDKLKGQKKTLKSFARSMFVSDDKQQKAWEELTHNGQYSLNEIMGILDDNNTNNAPTGRKGLFSKK